MYIEKFDHARVEVGTNERICYYDTRTGRLLAAAILARRPLLRWVCCVRRVDRPIAHLLRRRPRRRGGDSRPLLSLTKGTVAAVPQGPAACLQHRAT